MMTCLESTAIVGAEAGGRRRLSAHAATWAAKLRALAPYALIELVLPGGSLMAILLWLYRRRRKIALLQFH